MRLIVIFLFFTSQISFGQTLKGAWKNTSDTTQTLILATENYITITEYTTVGNRFIQAWGGKYEISKTEELFVDIAFHSKKAQIVGSNMSYNINQKKKSFVLFDKTFEKANQVKPNELSGLWRITSILKNNEMSAMPKGPRKTLKIMVDGYFQWFAINNVTSEFFGSGGGLYTLEKLKYTEEIVFFSRDNTRVGSKLTFDTIIKDTTWTHSGLSSKGSPLKEVWEKQ
jgi:hypothetical protein